MRDIYLYENSNVLKNKLNITDKLELETAEADFLTYRILELDTLTINANISVDFLKEIHKYLFQDIYDWAGEFRKINIEKYETVLNGLSVKYMEFSEIENELIKIFEFINTKNITKMNKEELAEYITDITSDIWKVHAFRERQYKNYNFIYL